MARLTTYIKQTPSDDDLLMGSEYISTGVNGIKNYTTANYKMSDLAGYFANFYVEEGSLYNLATISQQVSVNVTDISANATYSTNLSATFGTFDDEGNLQTLAQSFANQVFSTTSSTIFAQSSYVNNLSSSFGTFDSSGNLTSLSESFANNVMTTTNNSRFAESTFVNNLGSSFGTVAADGTVTISEAFADSVITTTASDRFATTTSVNTLTSTVEGKPDVFRQDDAPATTNPVGSIWYDTNDNNKVYVLISGTPNVWTETSDDRIVTNSQSISSVNQTVTTLSNSLGAEAALIDELQTQFTFDINGGITGTADALATSITTAQSNAESASATKVDTLASKFFTGYNNADGSFTAVSVTEAFADNVFETTTNTDFASASEFTALSAIVGGDDTEGLRADIIENADVIATVEGYAESRYSLKLDANGSFAGMSILAQNGATSDPYSEIRFVADAFKVYNGGQADLSGSYDAPFEVVNNVVKIKSANIGTVSFGDLSNVPTTFVSTVIYADDSSGTNASTTKGANQNFFAIKQADTAWQNGDSVSGLVFSQITGDTGATGPTGPAGQDGQDGQDGATGATGARSITTYIFYSTATTSSPTFNSTGVTYSFSTNSFSNLPSGWSNDAPVATPGSGSNNYWHIKATVVEGSSSNTITFSGVTRMFGFSGLVTFSGTTLTDGTSNFNYTTIDGSYITTGTINANRISTDLLRVGGNLTGSVNGVPVGTVTSGAAAGATAQQNNSAKTDGSVGGWAVDSNAIYSGTKDTSGYTSGGITIYSGGSIHTKQFYIDTNGNAFFKGSLSAATGTFSGSLSAATGTFSGNLSAAGGTFNGDLSAAGGTFSGSLSAATGTFSGNLSAAGGTFAGSISVSGTALIQGTDTTANAFTALKIVNTGSSGKVGFKLQNSVGYFCEMFLNTGTYAGVTGYGIDLNLGTNSNTVAHFNAGGLCVPAGTSGTSSYNGKSIFFNSDNASRTTSSGRLHVSDYFKAFFFDIPDSPLTSGTYANKGLVFRTNNSNSELGYMKPSTSSFHMNGDIVAYASSDKRLKDNINKLQNPLDKLEKINGYEFDWNKNQHLYEGHDIGVIAQEIEEVLPEIVETRKDGYKAVKYEKIVPLLIESIKELSDKIKALENGITK
jgi:hypothetical protein